LALAEVDKLTKLIPGTPGMTLKKAMDQTPDLVKLYKENPQVQQIIDIGKGWRGYAGTRGCMRPV